MRSLGENPTEQELEEIIREIDMDGESGVLLNECSGVSQKVANTTSNTIWQF